MGRKKIFDKDKKPVITLHINENLLSKIDNIAKEKNINRSLFIEQIVKAHIDNTE